MAENEILAEIHRYREELSRRFDYDIHKLMAYYRELEAEYKAKGHKFVSLAPSRSKDEISAVHEDPPDK